MRLERHDFTLTLELLSPLHIGNGDTERLGILRPAGRKSDPDVRTIVRDCNGMPWIPPTSLKGALRDLALKASRGPLFGREPGGTLDDGEIDTGAAGRLILWGGMLKGKVSDCALPYWSADRQSFILTRVRIDRATGAAMEGQLFLSEYVPAGANFEVQGCWQGSAVEFRQHVLPLLNRMAGDYGFGLGANGGAGFGRVRLMERAIVLKRKTLILDPQRKPTLVSSDRKFDIAPTLEPAARLFLHCPGPVLIVDPAAGENAERQGASELDTDDEPNAPEVADRGNSLRAMMQKAAMPAIFGTSLLGVLRSRASWLQQVHMGKDPDRPDHLLESADKKDELSPCERLFGVAGWAGQLQLVKVECSAKYFDNSYTGIALDDFTQGNIPGALFTMIAPADVWLEVHFVLDCARRETPDMYQLWKLLLDEIDEEGIELGHATGTGFGWFERVQDAASREAEKAQEKGEADATKAMA